MEQHAQKIVGAYITAEAGKFGIPGRVGYRQPSVARSNSYETGNPYLHRNVKVW